MKALFLLIVTCFVTQTALAEELLAEKFLSVKCHKTALGIVKAKKDALAKEVREQEGAGINLFFSHVGATKAGDVEPLPVTLGDSKELAQEGQLGSQHLLYVLAVRDQGKSQLGYGGYLVVQCKKDDASKVDDLNKDGKIDTEDVVWILN